VQAGEFDELAFFRAIQDAGARALLIGRRALVLLGLPVLTADYDFWIAIENIAIFNDAAAKCDLQPTMEPDAARRRGRYVLEHAEHVDVLVARSMTPVDGIDVAFETIWPRRRTIALTPETELHIPHLDDLILTKRFAARPKDLEDVRLLTILKSESNT